MRAVRQDRYGWDAVAVADVPVPEPGEGEVLVRVAAAGVNPFDWHHLAGQPLVARPMMGALRGPKPATRGVDVAGTVAKLGPGVDAFAVGDEVAGFSYAGSFAELALAKVHRLTARPDGVDVVQAGALPMAGVTALQFLRDGGKVTAGQKVAVIGAGGGIGHLALQLAKAWGAHVTAVCSGRNADLVRELGADDVVDYTQHDVTAGPARFDVVFANAGGYRWGELGELVVPGGTLLLNDGSKPGFLGPMPDMLTAPLLGRRKPYRVVNVMAESDPGDLAHLLGLVDAGTLRVVVSRTYPLERAVDAVREVAGRGHARGKVAVVP